MPSLRSLIALTPPTTYFGHTFHLILPQALLLLSFSLHFLPYMFSEHSMNCQTVQFLRTTQYKTQYFFPFIVHIFSPCLFVFISLNYLFCATYLIFNSIKLNKNHIFNYNYIYYLYLSFDIHYVSYQPTYLLSCFP